MEENKTTKKKTVKNPTQKVVEKKITPSRSEQDERILDMLAAGYNVNQVGSMLAVHTQYIKELQAQYNEEL